MILTEHELKTKIVICALLFPIFFTDKITKLKNSVSDTLRSLPASLPFHESFPPHCGPIFDILLPVTADEVRKLLSLSFPKSSVMDIILTSFILRCQSVFFLKSSRIWLIYLFLKASSLINSNKPQSHHCLRVVFLISPFHLTTGQFLI